MSTYLNKFKRLFSNGDSLHTIADRRTFFVSFAMLTTNPKYEFANGNLGFYVRKLTLPKIAIKGEGENVIRNVGGSYRIVENTTYLPDDNQFTMTVFDTEAPIIESFFYPWMIDVVSTNADRSQDTGITSKRIPKANIYIDFFDNKSASIRTLRYAVKEAFPVFIDTIDATYAGKGEGHERDIVFAFNDIEILPTSNIDIDSQKSSIKYVQSRNVKSNDYSKYIA